MAFLLAQESIASAAQPFVRLGISVRVPTLRVQVFRARAPGKPIRSAPAAMPPSPSRAPPPGLRSFVRA